MKNNMNKKSNMYDFRKYFAPLYTHRLFDKWSLNGYEKIWWQQETGGKNQTNGSWPLSANYDCVSRHFFLGSRLKILRFIASGRYMSDGLLCRQLLMIYNYVNYMYDFPLERSFSPFKELQLRLKQLGNYSLRHYLRTS